jgi:AcrR family transcriptional regulator
MSSPLTDEPTPPGCRSAKNPRTRRMRDAVLTAVAELISTEGAGAVTALRVSKRADVARSTIYDHWPSSEALVLDAIDMVTGPQASTPMTGDLEADLLNGLLSLRDRLEKRPFRIWFATLLDHGNRDPAFAAAQIRFVTGVLGPLSEIITAAQGRGQLTDDIDAADTAVHLAAPILTHHVLLRSTASDEQIAQTISQFLTSQTSNAPS